MKNFYLSRLRVLTWATLFAAAGLAACSDDKENDGPTPPPPVELENQIEYNGGALIDIKSAIYDIEDTDLYTFYLSPSGSVTDVDEMHTVNDFLRVTVRNPKGTVNTQTDEFEIAYKDISVNKATLKTDVEKVQLSAGLVAETSTLNLYVEVTMKSGKTLLARYNGTCTEATLPELDNEVALDRKISQIGSVVEQRDIPNGSTTYCFYSQKDITVPSAETPAILEIVFTDDIATEEIDFSTADLEKIKVTCGEFAVAAGTTGTLSMKKSTSGVGGTTLRVTLDAENDKGHLRADYSGAFAVGYASNNRFKVTSGETTKEANLKKVFHYTQSGGQHFMLGTKEDAAAPADLMEGYAVKMTVANLGKTIDLATEANSCSFALYDYATYKTYDINMASGKGATGTIRTDDAGNGNYYVQFSVSFPEGPKVEGDWFGAVTTAEETDLTPVEPFEPKFKIVTPDGSVEVDRTIDAMEVCRVKNYQDEWTGRKFDAYIFYFRNEMTDVNGGVDAEQATPQFVLSTETMSGDLKNGITLENLDLGAKNTNPIHWLLKYRTMHLVKGNNGYGYNDAERYVDDRCPDKASVTVKKNGQDWEFSLRMVDTGDFGYSGGKGSGNTFTIEWKGAASKYTGSKYQNDMTEDEY